MVWVTVVWLFAADDVGYLPGSGRGAARAEPARAAMKTSESCMLAEATVGFFLLKQRKR
jgi:hypothetical protein